MGKAARLFNGTAEQTLIGRLTPSQEQREFLQSQWNDLAEYLKPRLSEQYGYPTSTWLQGSYKYGTLIKPVHKGEEYDVDVGLYFEWEDDGEAKPSPGQLREWVQQALIVYMRRTAELREVIQPPKERCSRACFDARFHIDVPVYWLEPSSDSRQLATLSDKWEDSDPKAIYLWFKAFVERPERDQLRRLVRYLKGWAAVAFEGFSDSRPSSIVLTVLAAEAFSETLRKLLTMTSNPVTLTWLRFALANPSVDFRTESVLARIMRRHVTLREDDHHAKPARDF